MILKKLYLIFFAVLFSLGMFACTESTTTTDTQTNTATVTTAVVTTNEVTTTTTTTITTTQEVTTETPTTVITEEQNPMFNGVADRTVQMPDAVDLLDGITATDIQDGDITASIVVDSGTFVNTVKGAYEINLSITDTDGNVATAVFTITVADNRLTATNDLNSLTVELPLDLPGWSDGWATLFYWSSSDPYVITNSGYVINPPVGADPVDVTLTCRAVNGSSVVTKDFIVTVQPNPEIIITSTTQVDFVGTSTEYVVEDKTGIDLFYADNGSIAYIDVEEFFNMVDGAIVPSMVTFTPVGDDGLRLTYSVEYLDLDEVTVITDSYEAYIDFTENTVTVNTYDFFGQYIAPSESDYGSGLTYLGSEEAPPFAVTIPLGDYNCDIVIHEEGGETYYLMPLHIVNTLFLGGVYYDAYFNGDTIYGASLLMTEAEDQAALYSLMRTSSLNSEAMGDDVKLASYNFMALVIDYFYGLKMEKVTYTGFEILSAYAESMLTGNDQNLYNKIFDITYALDDLHTSHTFPGYYESPYGMGLSLSDLGAGTVAFYNGMWDMQDRLVDKYGGDSGTETDKSGFIDTNRPEFTLLDGDTIAVIHIDGFDIDTPDEFKVIMDGLPTTVTDVVIDMSYDTGGNLGAVLRIFGYMTEETYMYHSINPQDGSSYSYLYESEYVAYDYNWSILTSKMTFSAANLFASIGRELGIPILGQKATGGASSITQIITPDGSAIIVSSLNILATRTGNEVDGYVYTSIEHGVDIDYSMSDVTSDSQLVEIINQLRALQSE